MLTLIAHGHGIGDSMVLSAVARVAAENGHEVEVRCLHQELYLGNRDVRAVGYWNPLEAVPFWGIDDPGKTGGQHQVQWLCARLGLPVPPRERIRCYMELTDDEIGEWRGPHVTISPFGSWSENKNWMFGQWQAVVDALKAPVFQLGSADDPRLLRVDTSLMGAPLRTVASALAKAAFHLCPVTGTMHLASAVCTRSIVVYGGREDPLVTGYSQDAKIFRNPAQKCAPCWLISPCPYGTRHRLGFEKPCMQDIRFADVMDEIKRSYPWATVC